MRHYSGKICRILGRMTLVISLAVASLGLTAITAHAATNDRLIFTPTADAYVNKFRPGDNFGDSQGLLVRAETPARGMQTFMRFQVSGRTNRKLLDVRLRMFQSDPNGGSDVGGRVRAPISGPWEESTVTWSNKPPMSAPIRGKFGAVKSGHSYEISLGTSWLSGDGTFNLGMDSTSTNISQWGSREHHTPPQLILVLAPRSYPSMWVDNSPTRQAFIRFAVDGLSSPKLRTVTDVRLRLFQVDAALQGGRVFKITNDSWSESVTWNTKPPIDGPQ